MEGATPEQIREKLAKLKERLEKGTPSDGCDPESVELWKHVFWIEGSLLLIAEILTALHDAGSNSNSTAV